MHIVTYEDPVFSKNIMTGKDAMSKIHWHSKHELYYLVSGTTRYLIEDRFFSLQQGNLMFVPKGTLHMTDKTADSSRERFLLSFSDDMLPAGYQPFIDDLAEDNLIYIPADHLAEIDEIFSKIEQEYHDRNRYSHQMIQAYISPLIVAICRLKTKTEKHTLNSKEQLMYDISKYIRRNYHTNITLESLSELFFINKDYLSRKFKQVFRIGLNDYLTYIRIFHAERLLKTTDSSITQIAAACGFNDSNYFSTVFKQLKGITPRQFRKLSSDGIFQN